jgi:hypothetical protein
MAYRDSDQLIVLILRKGLTEYVACKGNICQASRIGGTNANLPAGNSKEGKIKLLSFTEASISEEPSAVVPHAGICAGAVR